MTLIPHSNARNVSGISSTDRSRIDDFLQGAVYCWCKNRGEEWFALRDLMGGETFGKKLNNMLIGRFYFKITPSGNLIGEYSHRNPTSRRSYAEAATRISPGCGWVGDYQTTWCEGPNFDIVSATLKISATQGAVGIFTVQWYENAQPNAKMMFDGEAMLCDEMLVGDYND